jgi:hypothetical protein
MFDICTRDKPVHALTPRKPDPTPPKFNRSERGNQEARFWSAASSELSLRTISAGNGHARVSMSCAQVRRPAVYQHKRGRAQVFVGVARSRP